MAGFEVVFKQSVTKDLLRIPPHQRYRVRQGAYRIVYEVKDGESLVVVVKVGHRRDVYRGR